MFSVAHRCREVNGDRAGLGLSNQALLQEGVGVEFVLASGLPLGPKTRFYRSLLFSFDNYFVVLRRAPSLTRGRVCSLQ
jgi:hypothetical protein